MDSSVLGVHGFLSGSTTTGILELQRSNLRHECGNLGNAQNTHYCHLQGGNNSVRNLESDQFRLMEGKGFSVKSNPMSFGKGKGIVVDGFVNGMSNCTNINTSEDDEPSFAEDGSDVHCDGGKGKKDSTWQRMKWTDNMVRLLITVVACVGEEGESGDGMKRKCGALQKKGKWKTISKIMVEKGCYVSPQQCEDKFNDLNKRYKRLNEILGRGTTCRVVENPVLLESMHQLSAKMKDDVRKILSSKHLFYQEMCAYHNGQPIPNSHEFDLQGCSLPVAVYHKDGVGIERNEDDENEESDNDDLDYEDHNDRDTDADKGETGKRRKINEEDGSFWSDSARQDSFIAEMAEILQDTTMSPWEQREWIKSRMLLLHEKRVSFQAQAFELEKQRFQWQKFCSKKDREMERLRLENERMRLENEQMALQLRQKELEIDFKMSEASLNPMSLGNG